MSSKLLTVRETKLSSDHSFEYVAIHILDLDILNELSKKEILKKWIPIWNKEYEEDVEPLSGNDWSFEDFIEYVHFKQVKEDNDYHIVFSTIDLNNEGLNDTEKLHKLLKEDRSYENGQKIEKIKNDIHFIERFINPFFEEHCIYSFDIKDSITYREKTVISIVTPKGTLTNF